MPTDSAEAIMRAARRARQDADHHVEAGDHGSAEALFRALADVDQTLAVASAVLRRFHRPLSVSGLGEGTDRLHDVVDDLVLGSHRRGLIDDDADDRWYRFVEEHPELAAPPAFTDDEILAALRVALEGRTEPWLQGAANSSDVVEVLLPDATTVRNNRATPLVVRTGKQLARLARQGHVVRLRQKWTKGRGGSIWSLPGIEVNEWWFKQFEAHDAR